MLQRIRAIQMSLCATAQRSVPVCHSQLLLFAPHLTCSKRSTSQVCTLNYWALCSSFTDCLFFSLHLPSWIKMPHSSRMDPSHNPLQQQQQQQQHQPLHGNSNMGGPWWTHALPQLLPESPDAHRQLWAGGPRGTWRCFRAGPWCKSESIIYSRSKQWLLAIVSTL